MTFSRDDDRHLMRKNKMTLGLDPSVLIYDHSGIVRSEENEQIALVGWFDVAYPQYRLSLFYVPNETFIKNKRTAQKKVEMGARSGVSDLILAIQVEGYPYALIELKKRGGMASENQIAFLNHHSRLGALCAVCRGFEAGKRFIKNYLQHVKQ